MRIQLNLLIISGYYYTSTLFHLCCNKLFFLYLGRERFKVVLIKRYLSALFKDAASLAVFCTKYNCLSLSFVHLYL